MDMSQWIQPAISSPKTWPNMTDSCFNCCDQEFTPHQCTANLEYLMSWRNGMWICVKIWHCSFEKIHQWTLKMTHWFDEGLQRAIPLHNYKGQTAIFLELCPVTENNCTDKYLCVKNSQSWRGCFSGRLCSRFSCISIWAKCLNLWIAQTAYNKTINKVEKGGV